MKEKIEKLMQNENLTAGKLAELLEIQPAVISHMRAGRNKPSFDLIQKILRRFPQINPDWLLLDSGEMYRDGYNRPADDEQPTADLFSPFEPKEQADLSGDAVGVVGASANASGRPTAENSTSRESHISELSAGRSEISNSYGTAKIERVIVFYSDGTFRDYAKR